MAAQPRNCVTRPSVRVHWIACGTCSVKGKFFQVGGSLRPFPNGHFHFHFHFSISISYFIIHLCHNFLLILGLILLKLKHASNRPVNPSCLQSNTKKLLLCHISTLSSEIQYTTYYTSQRQKIPQNLACVCSRYNARSDWLIVTEL